MGSSEEPETTDAPHWVNGYKMWVECDECDRGTTISLNGGVLAVQSDREECWEFTMVQDRDGLGPAGLAFKNTLCPDCAEDQEARDE